jgi:hypothetical protein
MPARRELAARTALRLLLQQGHGFTGPVLTNAKLRGFG